MRGGFVKVGPTSNSIMVFMLIGFVLLGLSLLTYVMGKADGKKDAYAACAIITEREQRINDIVVDQ